MKKIIFGEKSFVSFKNIYIDGKFCSYGKKIVNGFNKFFVLVIECFKQVFGSVFFGKRSVD